MVNADSPPWEKTEAPASKMEDWSLCSVEERDSDGAGGIHFSTLWLLL